MRGGECGCGAPQQPSGTAQEQGAGPGATCLVLPLLLIPSLWPLPWSPPSCTASAARRLVGEGSHQQLPSGKKHSHQGWATTKNSRAGSTRSKVDLTWRQLPSLSSISAAKSSPKLSPPGFPASISTELVLQAGPGAGPQWLGRMVGPHLPPHGWCQSPSPGLEEQKGDPALQRDAGEQLQVFK